MRSKMEGAFGGGASVIADAPFPRYAGQDDDQPKIARRRSRLAGGQSLFGIVVRVERRDAFRKV